MKYQKHGKANLLKMGNYGRFELAFLGTNCGNIKSLASEIAHKLSTLNLAYIDANHNHDESDKLHPFAVAYLDQQSYADISIFRKSNKFDHYFTYSDQDIILINGNHFQAQKQIVFLDRKKEASLFKRIDQLNDVQFFIQMEEDDYFPEFLREKLGGSIGQPIIKYSDRNEIHAKVNALYLDQKAPLYGLVLAGGHSTRMGVDKGKLQKKGKDLRVHIYDMLKLEVEQCYFSGRKDQLTELSAYPFVEDRLTNMGPFGAIISAFMLKPDAAWLVVACDQAKLDKNAFSQLIEARDLSKIATAFYSSKTGFPDPLPAIWEPKSYARLLDFLGLGYSCPRKVLINSDIKLLQPNEQDWLFNMNTPEDAKEANIEVG